MIVRRPQLAPALIVPDEQTWTMLGHDPVELGVEPSFRTGATSAVLVADRLPPGLSSSLAERLSELPVDVRVERRELALEGSLDPTRLLERREASDAPGAEIDPERAADWGADEGEGGHAGGGDMMEITGEPSADGLVMEPIEVRYGPLGVPFPGGLLIEASLDGDVVREVSVGSIEILARAPDDAPRLPDPLAPVAWTTAIARAEGGVSGLGGSIVAALELERAISHLAWLRALSRLLGWRRMTTRAAAVLAELTAIDRASVFLREAPEMLRPRLEAAAAALAGVLALLQGRSSRWRLAGLGVVAPDRAKALGAAGPNARASEAERDSRGEDPLYRGLGFAPTTEGAGDALARTLLRAREAAQAVDLARAALRMEGEMETGATRRTGAGVVEGPRGELRAEKVGGTWRLRSPGSAAARALAVEGMCGERWEDALVVLSSFDLSPWELQA